MASVLKNLRKAVLVTNSPQDSIVGIDNAAEIFKAARHPKSFISLDDTNHLLSKVKKAQAFHFKGGQGVKTGTGCHLPGNKVTKEIAQVRGLKEGEPAISPTAFRDRLRGTIAN